MAIAGKLDPTIFGGQNIYNDAINDTSFQVDSRALYSMAEDLRGIHPDIMTAEEYMQDIDEGGQELNLLKTGEKIRAEIVERAWVVLDLEGEAFPIRKGLYKSIALVNPDRGRPSWRRSVRWMGRTPTFSAIRLLVITDHRQLQRLLRSVELGWKSLQVIWP
jgi:hypothetical protein